MEDFDDIIQDFLVESHEMLDTLDEAFVELEENPTDDLVLGGIFRVMHTIKGTCGFLGFSHLEEVAHKGENLLSLLRDGKLRLDTEITDALLATVDAIRQFMAAIESTGTDQGVETAGLVATLVHLADPNATPPPPPAADTDTDDTAVADATAETADADETADTAVETVVEAETEAGVEVEAGADADRIGDILVERGDAERDDVEVAAAEQQFGDGRRIGEILVDHGDATTAQVAQALSQQQANRGSAADSTIRVDVSLLDDLMNLVGELVLTRNEIMQLVAQTPDGHFSASAQRLNIITSELQEGVMKTRMQPIGNVWGKLPRVVRDLSHQFGKRVRIEMEGKETELDKTIIEAIKDPLTHIVRNTVDHGIEAPAARTAAGKPAEGVLRLAASHEGGQVNIEISDDGAGISLDRIKAKAVERGLVTPEAAEMMSDTEATNLIFLPGFSTAKAVTNVSGRGVGMDVVKTNIEKIGGSVEVRTFPGTGTTFKIKIPLTLAIIPALIIGCAGKRYAIPQINLDELVRVDADDSKGIESVHGAPVFRLRGRLLPVVDLREQLGEPASERPPGDMVVLHADDRSFGVLVDDIFETQEIVVKPLGQVVQDLAMFSGATILGDGRVALIMDVLGLAAQANIISTRGDLAMPQGIQDSVGHGEWSDMRTLLLLGLGDDRRIAMALSDVARLEEFAPHEIERAGHRPVVQYRGTIMPLIDLASELGHGMGVADPDSSVSVVVYSHQGRDVGLVIGSVLDIVQEAIADGVGTGDSVVVQGRVTDLLDVSSLRSLRAIDQEFQLMGVS